MERFARPAVDHLKEVAWAVFMLLLILGLLALFFHRDLGTTVTLWLFGGLALMVVLVIGGLAVLNVLLVWLYERWERRASAWRRGRGRRT